jgi:hypothetical protein
MRNLFNLLAGIVLVIITLGLTAACGEDPAIMFDPPDLTINVPPPADISLSDELDLNCPNGDYTIELVDSSTRSYRQGDEARLITAQFYACNTINVGTHGLLPPPVTYINRTVNTEAGQTIYGPTNSDVVISVDRTIAKGSTLTVIYTGQISDNAGYGFTSVNLPLSSLDVIRVEDQKVARLDGNEDEVLNQRLEIIPPTDPRCANGIKVILERDDSMVSPYSGPGGANIEVIGMRMKSCNNAISFLGNTWNYRMDSGSNVTLWETTNSTRIRGQRMEVRRMDRLGVATYTIGSMIPNPLDPLNGNEANWEMYQSDFSGIFDLLGGETVGIVIYVDIREMQPGTQGSVTMAYQSSLFSLNGVFLAESQVFTTGNLNTVIHMMRQ